MIKILFYHLRILNLFSNTRTHMYTHKRRWWKAKTKLLNHF